MPTPAQEAEADRLLSAWRGVRRHMSRPGSTQNPAAERAAFDALVEYVDAHGLRHCKYDPRCASEKES